MVFKGCNGRYTIERKRYIIEGTLAIDILLTLHPTRHPRNRRESSADGSSWKTLEVFEGLGHLKIIETLAALASVLGSKEGSAEPARELEVLVTWGEGKRGVADERTVTVEEPPGHLKCLSPERGREDSAILRQREEGEKLSGQVLLQPVSIAEYLAARDSTSIWAGELSTAGD
ncbi:hypothetical protein C8F04DRAFT_1234887 [Mycena alexandri]|uniref:Uncharacterized protein n=1 Tax=Mycena alexandri TaxID=1745969 RepID=A0AAD6SSF8_9AGAR|nr:hypothetical protein C8F04DRAFT_1234887 [Mycena alexandri]